MGLKLTEKKLTEKQRLFCKEYIKDFNGTRSAIAAGYSEDSAPEIAAQNLTKLNIQEQIEKLTKKRNETLEIDANYVLQRLIEIDQLDVADLLDDNCNILPVKQWPKSWRTSISALDVSSIMSGDIETVIKKLKFPDKIKNLELLGRHTKVNAFTKEAQDDTDIPEALSYPYSVKQPVSDVKITKGVKKESNA